MDLSRCATCLMVGACGFLLGLELVIWFRHMDGLYISRWRLGMSVVFACRRALTGCVVLEGIARKAGYLQDGGWGWIGAYQGFDSLGRLYV